MPTRYFMAKSFREWVAEREQNEGVLDTISHVGEKLAQTHDFGKKTWDRLHLIARKPKGHRQPQIERTYDQVVGSIQKLQLRAQQGAESMSVKLAALPPVTATNELLALPGLKQLKWLLKILWSVMGGEKMLHAFLDAAPKTMWRPIKMFFHWIFKPEVEAKEIGKALVNLVKLIPALSFTGALKLTLPWQMDWLGWTMEEALQYNFILAWGMYIIYIAANLVKGNKWFNWYYKAVMMIFPDEFKSQQSPKPESAPPQLPSTTD
jgi:hypothetical protein